MKRKHKGIVAAILIPLAVGALSAILTKDNMIMFEFVKKPPLSPPAWLFPVVWTVLYVLMGVASYLVYASDSKNKGTALTFYAIQLAFNFFWSIIFFDLGNYAFAFYWLCALWLLILITTVMFFKADRTAGILMLPYLLWVSFAGYLNYAIMQLN